jgi:cytoskeletal protein CcmA (bactofilin family)
MSATLGKSVTIKGEIHGGEDLIIHGDMEGSIDLKGHHLTVGPEAKIRAGITARAVDVAGSVHGSVDAMERIEIRSNASLIGDIHTAKIVIEDGAYFKGAVDITKSADRAT